MTMRTLTCTLALMLALPLLAAEKKKTGMVCIAPFRIPSPAMGPAMSTTPAPGPNAIFEFRIGKLKKTVRENELASITGVPIDRKVMVGVRLNGKPFESFPLDLRKEKDRRACLWLYEGYWHWVNTGWSRAHGCRCGG